MNPTRWIRAFAVALALPAGFALAQSESGSSSGSGDTPPPPDNSKPQEVKKLDGTKFLGLVEITDDYTIRVRSDSGIIKIPMAMLGESDFKKYGFQTDRSKDGKFWYDRKEALEGQGQGQEGQQGQPNQPPGQQPQQKKESSSSDGTFMEIRLGELAPFQPLIDAYEKTLADKKTNDSGNADGSEQGKEGADTVTSAGSGSKFPPLFSQPGINNLGSVPFTGGLGDALVAPAVSAGSTVINSATSLGGAPPVTPP